MQRKMVVSVLFLGVMVLPLLLACGGAADVATQTSVPPTSQVTILPTITTLPTYTPQPTPTRLPTRTSEPTRTSVFAPKVTDTAVSPSVNCAPSNDPGYQRCMDNTASIQVDVPEAWTDVDGGNWTYQGKDIGVALSAAPNLENFRNSLNAEGVFFGASSTYARYVGSTELLDIYTIPYREACDIVKRSDYDDGVYTGKYDVYSNCGGNGGYDAYILAAKDKVDPLSKLILIEIQAFPGDQTIRDKIWSSFYVYF